MVVSEPAEIQPAPTTPMLDKLEEDQKTQFQLGYHFAKVAEPDFLPVEVDVDTTIIDEKCCCLFPNHVTNNRDSDRRSSAQVSSFFYFTFTLQNLKIENFFHTAIETFLFTYLSSSWSTISKMNLTTE